MRIRLFGLLAVSCFIISGLTLMAAPPQQDKKTDEERILGTWRAVKGEQSGQPMPADLQLVFRLTFAKEGKMKINLMDLDEKKKPEGKFIIVAPGQIDLTIDRDITKGIFKLDGDDRLTLCIAQSPQDNRPTKFDGGQGTGALLLVLERARPDEKLSAEELAKIKEAMKKVREQAAAQTSANNLRQMGVAMHNYHDVNMALPTHAIYSKDGKTPLLSWRVAILPFIEQEALYKEFKLDEPWDSAHNKKLIAKMPALYLSPTDANPKDAGLTYYQVFTGPDTVFDGNKKMTLPKITDGTSNTIMIVEAADPVIWTRPADLTLPQDKTKMPPLGGIFKDRMNILLCDGSVRMVHNVQDPALLRALVTPNGQEIADPSKLK